MSRRVFDHLDLRVRDVAAAKPLYDALLRAFGMRGRPLEDGTMLYLRISGGEIAEAVALIEDREHRPNAMRLAFAASTTEEVDRIAVRVVAAGAKSAEGPAWCPEIAPNYYAFFFEDGEGNKLEIVCR